VRARAVDPSFVLDETNADAVATICRRLDGLPLAIELAATQSRRLAPAALAERLEQALDLLVEGARDVPLRQQTLRATLDWSYRLLEPAEQQLLARLAVFSGSSAVGDVHAVVGGDAADLSALVDKSLLRSVPDGDTARVAMLETIREYALEQLAGSGEEARYRRLHAEHYLELAERAASTILNGGDETVYERLDAEHDNLRAALTWLQGRDLALELRLAIALRWFWVVRGYLSEARRFYEVTIANVDSGGTPAQRADARAHGGVFAYRQGDLAAAQRDWEQALELYRETDNLDGVSRCTAELGAVALGNGEIDAARTLYEQAAELYRQHGYPVRLGIALSNLTDIARTVGDAAAAVRYGKQAVEIAREIGDKDGLAVALYNLARAAKDVGEDARARCLLAESLELARRLGYREVTAYCLEGAAELALADGDPERAARLLSASDALFAGIGAKLQGPESETRARVLAELRERLGDEVLAALGEQAAGVRFEDVLDEALALTATP
jgi:tetratricopeptide (TPR) repeat protein